MGMTWDPFLTRAVARELDAVLRGGRARALLLDRERRHATLYLRDATLVAELHPQDGWISLLDPVEPVPTDARPLASRVVAVEPLPDESALRISLQRVRGRDEGVELILEFSANRGNALVVGHRSRLVRHVLLPRTPRPGGRGRVLVPGAPWEPLPTGGRRGAPGAPPLDAEGFRELVAQGRTGFLRSVAGASSLNADLLMGPGGWEAWGAMQNPDAWGAWHTDGPRGRILYPLPLSPRPDAETDEETEAGTETGTEAGTGTGTGTEAFPSLLEGIQRLRAEGDAPPASALLLPAALVARGERRERDLRRAAASLRRQLEKAPDPEPLRARGNLLLARFDRVPRGQSSVVLDDFDGSPVEVELDPALQVHENARRYFDEAGRAERTRAQLPARVAEARDRLERWSTLLQGVQNGSLPLSELEAALAALGPESRGGSGRTGPGSAAGSEGTSLPYHRFQSSGGLEIRVGRGARKNDDLTFRHAAPGDIWLHVREAPGAHVILRWSEAGNPPARDLQEAAILAAVNSDARHAGMVPVDWTRRKHVRKPRKSAPGAVIPQQVQTLFVEPDADLPARLRDRESRSREV